MTKRDLSLNIAGNRVGLLLLHGLCGTPLEMRYVAYGAARSGFTVHCPLIAGHGGEESDVATSTWQDWYASAETALHEIRKECDIVLVGGLSTGALLGAAAGRAESESWSRGPCPTRRPSGSMAG